MYFVSYAWKSERNIFVCQGVVVWFEENNRFCGQCLWTVANNRNKVLFWGRKELWCSVTKKNQAPLNQRQSLFVCFFSGEDCGRFSLFYSIPIVARMLWSFHHIHHHYQLPLCCDCKGPVPSNATQVDCANWTSSWFWLACSGTRSWFVIRSIWVPVLSLGDVFLLNIYKKKYPN